MTAPVRDPRLGRRFVGHDERSRAFGVAGQLGPVQRRPTFWAFPSASGMPLDQGREGACTAFSFGHEQAAGPVQVLGRTNEWARAFFRQVQATDRRLGNDVDGGATMLAAAKTARAAGYITAYRWCFGVDQVVDTLCSVGPVWLGIPWLDAMYRTAADGLVTVAGKVVGGHAICAVGYDVHPQHGPVVAWANTWGRLYGVPEPRLGLPAGVGYVRVPDLARLLAREGEAIVAADYLPATGQP